MSLQRRDDHLTKTISDAPGKLARCLPSKVKELLRKKCLSDSFWNKMIVISCVIAISLDPLFLYIPFIDEGKRCLGMDKRLWDVALILRSLTDITFVVDIGYQIYEGLNQAYKEINGRKSDWQKDWQPTLIRRDEIIPFAKIFARDLTWRPLVTDLLSAFPMPQLLMKVFFKMWWSGYSEPRKVVNFFLLIQYLPRIYRIILASSELTRTIRIPIKAIFNFFLYILASHVIGAFWYFYSIERETLCWHQACQNQIDPERCMSTFYCDHDNSAQPNITFFDEHCNIDVPYNATEPFKYGIFLDSLKSGIAGNKHFPTKLCYSFWWGLRNLSNFGTNLATSSSLWENLFAIQISITGLLLFVYLIGNVQTFIQMRTTQSEEIRKKIEFKKEATDMWMEKNAIPDDKRKEIRKMIKRSDRHLEGDKDAVLENLFNVVPGYMQKFLKHFLCMKILKEVDLLQLMDDSVLKMMCDCLKPVTYAVDHIIFPKEHPIDRMLLIIKGTVLTYSITPIPSLTPGEETTKDSGAAPSMATKQLGKGGVYGEELLTWASPEKTGIDNLPTSNEYVKCHTKVEGFVLSAQDLLKVVSKSKQLWKLNIGP
ncbi:cyclic nucleotide-gated ion channel 1-like isoform X1 [Prunus avium]|uniref:Cyclic nucleotide-gated ion channel 1-like isoform X1 n=2 Tax=Prunus avium TaxID=42229 RepID=A0A6P5SPN7_PRUAV|nr:cyclic nucleotide-gated ion channel 1-like isoform X1 [Prunus avium]